MKPGIPDLKSEVVFSCFGSYDLTNRVGSKHLPKEALLQQLARRSSYAFSGEEAALIGRSNLVGCNSLKNRV